MITYIGQHFPLLVMIGIGLFSLVLLGVTLQDQAGGRRHGS